MEEEIVSQEENSKHDENIQEVVSEESVTEETVEEDNQSQESSQQEVGQVYTKKERKRKKASKEEEIEEVKEESENFEKVLEEVSDEFLAKKKRKRTVTYSIISAIVLALATVIIVLSCIKVDLRPAFIGDALSYRVTISGSERMTLDESNEEFEEFNETYLKSFRTRYLTALFTGRLGGYTITETASNFYTSTTSKTPSSALRNELGQNYVRVLLSEEQQILNSNGKVYYSVFNSNKTFTFDEMYFNLSTENSSQDLTLFLGGKREGTDSVRIIKINVRANTYNLYKMVTE